LEAIENWIEIPDYMDYAEVSDQGRVRTLDRIVAHKRYGTMMLKGKILHTSQNRKGYLRTNLNTNGKTESHLIHRLVARAFLPPQPTPEHQINHKDGDKTNNKPSNIEWVTAQGNSDHAWDIGLCKKETSQGINNGRARLSADQVLEIRDMHKNGLNGMEISEKLSISNGTIYNIINKRTWKNL